MIVVRFLADYARVHPMSKEDHPVADRLISLAEPLLEAWYGEPYDYLGQLFSEKECAIDEMGQVITPRSPNWRFANRWSPPDWQRAHRGGVDRA